LVVRSLLLFRKPDSICPNLSIALFPRMAHRLAITLAAKKLSPFYSSLSVAPSILQNALASRNHSRRHPPPGGNAIRAFAKPAAPTETPPEEIPDWMNPNHVKDYDSRIFIEDFAPGEEVPLVPLPPFDDGSGKVLASPELHALAEEIIHMSLVEVHQLVQLATVHFDLDDEPEEVSVEKEEEVAEEVKTLFDLKLVAFDPKTKIKVIKEVRSITALGLKEAKDMVEGAPKILLKDMKMENAEELKAKLVAAGATVEII